MDSHGYCKKLEETARFLGYDIIKHELFPFNDNPLNPTALTIISKKTNIENQPTCVFACPKFKTPLIKIKDAWFSPEALAVYPIIGGIACLRSENSIFASKYQELCINENN